MKIHERARRKAVALLAEGELTVADVVRLLRYRVSRPTVDYWAKEAGINLKAARRQRANRYRQHVNRIWKETDETRLSSR
jgi:hypothetical protein